MIALPPLYQPYQFTPEELALGLQFSALVEARLQDMLADKVQSRVGLSFDAAVPSDFLQAEAYLKGQIELLEELLAPPQQRTLIAIPM